MTLKVLVTRRIPDQGMRLLEGKVDLEVSPYDRVLCRDELLRLARGKDGILSLLSDRIDAEVMDQNPSLTVISNYAVGYDNIDVAEATRRGILVTNTPGVLTEAVADFTWALLLAAARRVPEADRFTREGKFEGWGPMLFLGYDVSGKTLGIVGYGRIGKAVARRSRGFQMKLLVSDPSYPPGTTIEDETDPLCTVGATVVSLETLLREADFVTLHLSLKRETHHLIGRRELALMKETAILINAARGPVVDEKALVEALLEKRIAGAALDVYEEEPFLTPGLRDLPNGVLAPHIASATWETRGEMARIAAENLLAALTGEKVQNLVNPEVQVKG